MEVSGQLHARFTHGGRTWYTLDSMLGGHKNRSGRGAEEKNSQPPPTIKP
jgi:hypothetical protein